MSRYVCIAHALVSAGLEQQTAKRPKSTRVGTAAVPPLASGELATPYAFLRPIPLAEQGLPPRTPVDALPPSPVPHLKRLEWLKRPVTDACCFLLTRLLSSGVWSRDVR